MAGERGLTRSEFVNRDGSWTSCSACGARARIFMRRMDWQGPEDLYLDHACAPSVPL